PRIAYRVQVAHRPLVGPHAVAVHPPQEHLVLASAQPLDRLLLGWAALGWAARRWAALGWVVGLALRQRDAAGRQEGPGAVGARLAVDVLVVVGDRVEGYERLPGACRALAQEVVEQLLPGCGVHRGGRCQDTVQVEQTGADGGR